MNYGFINEIMSRDESPFVIKGGHQYKEISTKNMLFLDQMLYCEAGRSCKSFIKAYTGIASKFICPYEFFDSYEKRETPIEEIKRVHFLVLCELRSRKRVT